MHACRVRARRPNSSRARRCKPCAETGWKKLVTTNRRAVRQLERHVQGLVRASEHVRDRLFLESVMPELTDLHWTTEKSLPIHSPSKFID